MQRPIKLILCLSIALIAFFAIITHQSWINGSWYWKWDWRDLSALPASRYYIAMLLAALPMIIAWLLPERARIVSIILICFAVIVMKITSLAILTRPMSFAVLDAIVRSPS